MPFSRISPLDVDNDRAGNRLDRFHADELQLKEHEGRLRHNPNTPGRGPEDHARHLAADWAGGSPHLDNLVSMLDRVNLREYGGLERSWRSVLNHVPPGTVSVDVRIVTDASAGRPTQFIVDYVVNGHPEHAVMKQ